jgi:hypothetical protein
VYVTLANTPFTVKFNEQDLPIISVGLDKRLCQNIKWFNFENFTLSFNLPVAVGMNTPLYLDFSPTGVNYTATSSISFYPPVITNISLSNGNCIGGTNITFQIQNIGLPNLDFIEIFFGGDSAFSVKQLSSNQVSCLSPSSKGPQTVNVTASVGGQRSNFITFTYDAPIVKSISPSSGVLPSGGSLLSINGSNFGVCTSSCPVISVKINHLDCTSVVLISDAQVNCTIPPGIGKNLNVNVVINGFSNIPNTLFAYIAPKVISITPSQSIGKLGDSFSISGNYFGTLNSNIKVIFISQDDGIRYYAGNPTWVSNTFATGTLPDIGNGSFVVAIEVAEQESSDQIIYRNSNTNRPPSAKNVSYEIFQNAILVVSFQVSDPDGDTTTVELQSLPDNGTLYQYVSGNLDPKGNQISFLPSIITSSDKYAVFIPQKNFFGTTKFSYIGSDQQKTPSAIAWVLINVTFVNQRPFMTT